MLLQNRDKIFSIDKFYIYNFVLLFLVSYFIIFDYSHFALGISAFFILFGFETINTKPIKIYAYDQKLNKKRIVQLDDLLCLINRGDFNDENTTFYYHTAYERDIDDEKHHEKGVTTLY